MADEQEQTAIVPITEVLPELRDEQYAKVCEWDAARMALAGEYEAADGEYLKKIRDELKVAGHGLWTRYLEARGIPRMTANERIRKTEGRYIAPKRTESVRFTQEPEPAPDMVMIPTSEYQELKHRERLGEMYAAEKGYLKSQQDYRNGDLPVEPEPPAVSPTYGAAWDDGDEWATDARTPRGTPLSAYIPKVTLPDSPLESEVRRLRTEFERQSPSRAAMPFADALIKLAQCVLLDSRTVDAWLDASPPSDWPAALETLRRIAEWAGDMTARFDARRRDSLRLVP